MTQPSEIGRLCLFHGKPLGPPPARNCEDCRAAIDATLGHNGGGNDV